MSTNRGEVHCITLSKRLDKLKGISRGLNPIVWQFSLIHYKDSYKDDVKVIGTFDMLEAAMEAAEANEEEREEEEAEQVFIIGVERSYEVMARTVEEAMVKYQTGKVDWKGEETVTHVLDADGNNHTEVTD